MQIMSVLLVFLFKVGSWTEGGRAPHSVFDQCMGVGSMNPSGLMIIRVMLIFYNYEDHWIKSFS